VPGECSRSPFRVAGTPPSVDLPQGLIQFTVRGESTTHDLVIDGVPSFRAAVTFPNMATKVETVRMAPGRYLMHCVIPGHTAAGMEMWLIVR
jgi:plastocyanin